MLRVARAIGIGCGLWLWASSPGLSAQEEGKEAPSGSKAERDYDANARLVDSVQVGDSSVTVYGTRDLPAVGYGLVANLTALGMVLILDIIETEPSEVAYIVVPLREEVDVTRLEP